MHVASHMMRPIVTPSPRDVINAGRSEFADFPTNGAAGDCRQAAARHPVRAVPAGKPPDRKPAVRPARHQPSFTEGGAAQSRGRTADRDRAQPRPAVPALSWEEATAIYEVRELLEVEAAGRCALRIATEQLRELERSLLAFEEAAASHDSLAQVTTAADFYSIILANCGNPILEEVHRGLVARISFFRGRSMSLEGRAQSSLAEMREIYESIAAGDEKAARKASKKHLLKAKAAAKISMDSVS